MIPRTRRLTTDDLPALAGLFDEYRQFYRQAPDYDSCLAFLRERANLNDSLVLVAEYAPGELAGFIQCYPSFSSIGLQKIWILNDLYVDETARKRGVAQALLEQAVAEAQVLGISQLRLATLPDNDQAMALYERLGFVADGYQHFALKLDGQTAARDAA